ncbi:nuclear transport factor 2 family protein [Emcibacter sp.]|uniref:nuclear transport factor 2 family protein n=1 Tax=Emcibacter sp. TaxID=1979954 RepID=UPI003A9496DA
MTDNSDLRAELDALASRVGSLEDMQAIRKLHYSYGYYIDFCQYDEVVQLFADDGEVIFLSGIYKGKEGVARLYKTWFQNYFTHGKPGPEDGFLLDHFQMQDIITVAPDRKTAKGRFRAILMGGVHESRDYKPEGLPEQFYEAGIYENDYVCENGVWKIKRLDYMVQWQAEYEKGWSKTDAHLQPAVEVFPGNPLGPDELLPEPRLTWPSRHDVPMHFAHPVMGKAYKPFEE